MSNAKWSPLREHLIEFTSGETGMNQAEAGSFVSRFFGIIADHIVRSETTEIRGLGSFRWTLCKARKFRSGVFGKRTVPAYWKLSFRSKSLKGSYAGNKR